MKRIIYALAALWPMAKMLKRTGSSPSKSAIHPAEREEASVLATVSNLQDANSGRHLKNDFILCFLKHIAIKFANKCSFSDIYPLTKENLREARNLLYALRSRNSYVKAFTILFMCLIAVFEAPAQTGAAANTDSIQPLQIGDKIPEELWHLPLQVVNHPEGKETITLNDYRGKLIILDFWATWCGPCISSLYKLDTLQAAFASELAVIPTTYELPDKVKPFFEEKGWVIPTVTSDSVLKKFFPHGMIPHQIWIIENTLRGIANHTDATVQNIIKIRDDQDYTIHSKADIVDYSRTNHLGKYAEQANTDIVYSSILTKRIKGLPSRMDRVEVENAHIINYVNTSVISMYQRTLGVDFNKITLEVNAQDGTVSSKLNADVYSYQLKVAKEKPTHSINKQVLYDLNNHFHYTLARKTLERDCYIIIEAEESVTRRDSQIHLQSSEDELADYNLDTFVDLLNSSSVWDQDLAIYLNESDFNGEISAPHYKILQNDSKMLKSTLAHYGLEIRREKRPILMYVLSDKFNRKLIVD